MSAEGAATISDVEHEFGVRLYKEYDGKVVIYKEHYETSLAIKEIIDSAAKVSAVLVEPKFQSLFEEFSFKIDPDDQISTFIISDESMGVGVYVTFEEGTPEDFIEKYELYYLWE